MIGKNQTDPNHFRINMFYYHRARDAMFDAVSELCRKGFRDIFIPGYIGWSPKEGSGIFDPLNRVEGLKRHYYRMTGDLAVDLEDLESILIPGSILLTVTYFGFRDRQLGKVTALARERNCAVIEDNAHGFFTWFCGGPSDADITFFSLHKMFPFAEGGSLLIRNEKLGIEPQEALEDHSHIDPFAYDINGIARKRTENYRALTELMQGNEEYFVPFRPLEDLAQNIPQTFPILIRRGDRFKVYERMNAQGYGVVSLYHTLIGELQTERYEEALGLSRCILNLPVHQDTDSREYPGMIEALREACRNS